MNRLGRPATPLAERFWEKVEKRGPDDCWEWTGQRDRHGYGRIRTDQGGRTASRVSWMLAHGHPGKAFVCHRCDNPPCVNPAHLFLGSALENNADRDAKGRTSRVGCKRRGEAHHKSNITEDAARRIKFGGEKMAALSRELRVPYSTVSAIRHGHNWAWLEPSQQSRVAALFAPATGAGDGQSLRATLSQQARTALQE